MTTSVKTTLMVDSAEMLLTLEALETSSVLRYSGYNLQAFSQPHQGVIVNVDIVD